MIFLILPNQLFEDVKPLKAYEELFIIEEPHYFSSGSNNGLSKLVKCHAL